FNGAAGEHLLLLPFAREGALLLFYVFSILFTILYLELDAIRAYIRYVLFLLIVVLAVALVLAALDLQFIGPYLPYLGLCVLFFLVASGLNAVVLRVGGALAHLLAFGVVFLGTLSDISLGWNSEGPGAGGDIRAIAYALCAMLFAVVIASQFARR